MNDYRAILLQRDSEDQLLHPIITSGKTTSAEEKYMKYELEVVAIIRALCVEVQIYTLIYTFYVYLLRI